VSVAALDGFVELAAKGPPTRLRRPIPTRAVEDDGVNRAARHVKSTAFDSVVDLEEERADRQAVGIAQADVLSLLRSDSHDDCASRGLRVAALLD